MERIMKAVLKPSDEGDTLLRGLAEDNAAQKLLEVRRLIDSAA